MCVREGRRGVRGRRIRGVASSRRLFTQGPAAGGAGPGVGAAAGDPFGGDPLLRRQCGARGPLSPTSAFDDRE